VVFSRLNQAYKCRNDIFDQAKEAKGRSWRDFIGDVMIHFFENTDAEELLELLTKNMYLISAVIQMRQKLWELILKLQKKITVN
jgi:hypothetical protein